jgi:hypothetical protein
MRRAPGGHSIPKCEARSACGVLAEVSADDIEVVVSYLCGSLLGYATLDVVQVDAAFERIADLSRHSRFVER